MLNMIGAVVVAFSDRLLAATLVHRSGVGRLKRMRACKESMPAPATPHRPGYLRGTLLNDRRELRTIYARKVSIAYWQRLSEDQISEGQPDDYLGLLNRE